MVKITNKSVKTTHNQYYGCFDQIKLVKKRCVWDNQFKLVISTNLSLQRGVCYKTAFMSWNSQFNVVFRKTTLLRILLRPQIIQTVCFPRKLNLFRRCGFSKSVYCHYLLWHRPWDRSSSYCRILPVYLHGPHVWDIMWKNRTYYLQIWVYCRIIS